MSQEEKKVITAPAWWCGFRKLRGAWGNLGLQCVAGVCGGSVVWMIKAQKSDGERIYQALKTDSNVRHVTVALDGSKISDGVLDWCTSHVFHKNDKISLIHAAEYHTVTFLPASDIGSFSGGALLSDINESVKKDAVSKGTKYLQTMAQKAVDKGFKPTELKLLLAHPATSVKAAICDYVEDHKPHMLICGSRGMGTMGRAFLGSVSDYLMHNAKCTVMVVKAAQIEKLAQEKKEGSSS